MEPQKSPILNAFVEFLSVREPSLMAESYKKVRRLIIESGYYNPHSDDLKQFSAKARGLIEGTSTEALPPISPNFILSVEAHFMTALTHKKKGDTKGYEMEMFFAGHLGLGLRSTGDGSKEKPYLVLRTSDEYDVLMMLKKEFSGQSLQETPEGMRDVLHCKDGSEIWFDISDMWKRQGELMGR